MGIVLGVRLDWRFVDRVENKVNVVVGVVVVIIDRNSALLISDTKRALLTMEKFAALLSAVRTLIFRCVHASL